MLKAKSSTGGLLHHSYLWGFVFFCFSDSRTAGLIDTFVDFHSKNLDDLDDVGYALRRTA